MTVSTPRPPEPTVVLLRVGELDGTSTRHARRLLRELCRRPGIELLVDLERLDDRHVVTMFALLAEADRSLAGRGRVTALHPPRRLTPTLTAAGIAVADGPPGAGPAAEVLEAGRLPNQRASDPAAPYPTGRAAASNTTETR